MKRHHRSAVALSCAIFTSFVPQAYAQAQGDGTYYDVKTGLTWMRCMVGQTWANGTCTGAATTHTFDEATALRGKVSFAGQSDWRMPNIRELNSIVDFSKASPAIDTNQFPKSSTSVVWSGSPFVGYSSYVWRVDFSGGRSSSGGTATSYCYRCIPYTPGAGVRLVRGGQSLGLLSPARPTEDYQNNGDGTVTHKPTDLMWKRCAEGQSWSGSTCTGAAGQFQWVNAKAITSSFAGKTDWRLPTIQELQSLVDYTKSDPTPTLNTTIFPNNSVSGVWSGSPYANSAGYAWSVGFSSGNSFENSLNGDLGVRLVRNAQSSSPLPPTDRNCLLDWAESRFASLFSPANSPTHTAGSISYRAYAGNVFLGIDGNSNAVLVVGGGFGVWPVSVGQVADFLPTARATACK